MATLPAVLVLPAPCLPLMPILRKAEVFWAGLNRVMAVIGIAPVGLGRGGLSRPEGLCCDQECAGRVQTQLIFREREAVSRDFAGTVAIDRLMHRLSGDLLR